MAEIKTYKFTPDYEAAALTQNGAISHDTTTSVMADQFAKAGNYRGRDVKEVFAEQQALWESNKIQALRFPFYLRMITRKAKINSKNVTEKVQKGQGARDEAFKRLLWFASNEPEVFYKNIWMLPIVGSWKDLWQLMYYDEILELNCLQRPILYDLILQGSKSESHCELIKKFMPRIKSNGKCTTDWTRITNKHAKEFARHCKMLYTEYNKFKSTGTAHDFQKIICGRRYEDIDWSIIPGRALSLITSGRFLENHSLTEKYTEWLVAQPTVKFTGYVYELITQLKKNRGYMYDPKRISLSKRITIDKQFDELIRKASEDGTPLGNVWCALDTSGSMSSLAAPTMNVTCMDVCIGLGVFLSTLNKGAFHKNVIMFDNESRVKQLKGSFSDMVNQIVEDGVAWGDTNFQSVVDLIVDIRKNNPDIPLDDYPDTLLVVSDMQFNPVEGNAETNYQAMKKKLSEVFPGEFVENMKFIWWQVNAKTTDFPAQVGKGQIFLSGYDPSIVSLLLGGEVREMEQVMGRPITTEESIAIALSQEVLQYVNV